MQLLYEDYEPVDLSIPYLPGYLGFRECDAYNRLLRSVEDSPHRPQVLLVDGCGLLHPRGCGSACQVGITCGYPAVGVAKNLLTVDGLDRFAVRRQLQVRHVPLVGHSGAVHGVALCPGLSRKPLFISVGHRLSLPTAVEIVRRCCLHRVPEPIRQADLRSRQWLREHM
ncbi:hypothetical protein VOLCADRAFT_60257 [Volvox carteri f. nagariensis]|uniref:Endonuclease V n=1 Tax=Volvox carteri f. nagariensis TaxID=3068 RepID=D8TVG1_VOLCA|nr:uncharacterized protein VOLCADRAFT_60257 [Volvox carteri f. nagariensis]EFJ48572.1 hypothetical protein VOLCADRAFT_60257 [Volvox carteri f. nagariensis]|eukprot:XP_002950371.1 hypothetical protein VOLCADRAFT_60257 [Volvox carteri f. nagariensis]